MSGTIKTGSHDLNGVPTDYNFPDPVGDVQTHTGMQVDGQQTDYHSGPAVGSVDSLTHKLNGVVSKYFFPNTTGFGSAGGGGAPPSEITRYLTPLDPSLTQHYTLDSTVTLSGDFEIEADALTTVSHQGTLIGTSSNNYGMYVSTSEAIVVLMDGANLNSGNSVFEIGKLNKIGLTRVGPLVTLLYNGVSVDTGNTTAPFDVKRMGLWNDLLSNFNGIISNVTIREGVGNTLIHSWALDEDFSGTTTASDSVGSNPATAVNVVASEFVTQQAARNYTEYDGSADYCTIPTVTLSGDFEVEFDFSINSDSPENTIIAHELYSKVRVNNNGNLNLLAGNGSSWSLLLTSSTVPFNDGKQHTGIVTRVGDLYSIFGDGVLLDSGSTSTATPQFTRIGNNSTGSGNLFNGIIANTKITDDGDLIRNYEGKEDFASSTDLIDTGTDGLDGTAVSITSANVSSMASWLTADSGAILIAEQA